MLMSWFSKVFGARFSMANHFFDDLVLTDQVARTPGYHDLRSLAQNSMIFAFCDREVASDLFLEARGHVKLNRLRHNQSSMAGESTLAANPDLHSISIHPTYLAFERRPYTRPGPVPK